VRFIELIRGWTRYQMADGVVLVPPAGSSAGAVRIREARRPLLPLRTIIASIVSELSEGKSGPFAVPLAVSKVRRLFTSEGEHAALFTISAQRPGAKEGEVSQQRIIGIVLGDDCYTQIDGAAESPQEITACREIVTFLTEHYFQGLGGDRRRRFEYAPPAGWAAVRRSHGTSYYAPGYPKRPAIITTYLTRPTTTSVPELMDRMVFMDALVGVQRDKEEPPRPLQATAGLSGQLHRITGRHPVAGPVVFHQATLRDSRFTYIVDLQSTEGTEAETLPVFLETARSVQPIPANQTHASSGLLIQWAE
jgi:hypothetical protein